MSSGYSFAAWKAYCHARVLVQHEHDAGQLLRYKRLLTETDAKAAWKKLANDVKEWPSNLGSHTWQDALHEVIGILIFPPNRNDGEAGRKVLDLYRPHKDLVTGEGPLPLLPAAKSEHPERNWLALYLKTWIIPLHFNRPHYDEIAGLVNAVLALKPEDYSSGEDVRKLKARRFRKPYQPRRKSSSTTRK